MKLDTKQDITKDRTDFFQFIKCIEINKENKNSEFADEKKMSKSSRRN